MGSRIRCSCLAVFVMVMLVSLVLSCSKNRKKEYKIISKELVYSCNDDIVFGDPNATFNIILFGNYNCKFCRKFFKEDLQLILKDYKGSVKISYKMIPSSSSQEEINAFKMALSVNKYGNFSAYHNLLLKEDKIIYTSNFEDYLNEIMQYNQAIADYYYDDNKAIGIITNNVKLYKKLNITGTPAYLINDKLFIGHKNYKELKEIIEQFKK